MNLQRHREEEVEVNLTPLIDVVFLLLIFFMVSTTFVRESEISLDLPEASAEVAAEDVDKVEISVDKEGSFYVNGRALLNGKPQTLRAAISAAVESLQDPLVLVSADAQSAHQDVVRILDAARQLGLVRISFTTEIRDDEQ